MYMYKHLLMKLTIQSVHMDSVDVKGEGGEAGEGGETERDLSSHLTDSFHSLSISSFCEPAFPRRV